MTHAAPPPPVLAIISDLLFRSKIDDAARQSGVPLRVAKSAEQLARLRATSGAATVPVIGFAGHTNVDVIRAARADGVQVMARSAFVDQLPTLMSRLATAHGD
jgi:hypothetical protein